jgi:hypothetical protein
MRKLFTFTSKVTLNLPENRNDLVEPLLWALKKRLSSLSGEDADRSGNEIYFAINTRGYGFQFFGIDSGQVKVEVVADKVLVHYRLSYLSPLLPFSILDIFLVWLSLIVPGREDTKAFTVLVTMALFVILFGIVITIISFPFLIQGIWYSILKEVNSHS